MIWLIIIELFYNKILYCTNDDILEHLNDKGICIFFSKEATYQVCWQAVSPHPIDSIQFKADFHIHSVLSPWEDIELSPCAFVAQAQAKGLDIIDLTGFNSTLNTDKMRRLGKRMGLLVLLEEEVITKEEVHAWVWFIMVFF